MALRDSPLLIIIILMGVSFIIGLIWLFFLSLLAFILYILLALISKTGKKTYGAAKGFASETVGEMDKSEGQPINMKVWEEALSNVGGKAGEQVFNSAERFSSQDTGTRASKGAQNVIGKFRELFG